MKRLRRGWEKRKEEQEAEKQVAPGANGAQSRAKAANPHRQTKGRIRQSDVKAARRFEQKHYGN